MQPLDVFQKLIDQAIMRRYMVGSPDPDRLKECFRSGKEIPADLLPGALLQTLTNEERECLSKLTSHEVTNRRKDY